MADDEMDKKTGNSVFLKQYNRRQMLSLIRKHEKISYVELTNLSGLAPKSVYEICDGLKKDGFLYESAVGQSGGGRKPKMLSLKPNSYFSVGVDIDVGCVNIILMDIAGNICDEYEQSMDTILYDIYLDAISGNILKILRKHAIKNDRFLGVGVSAPGFISALTKHIVMAPNLGWEDKDIIKDLCERLACDISLENEALASAICEKWIGECQNDEDFICINIKSGIGAGIYVSGKPCRGKGGSAGEIGHIPLKKDGPLCGCKNRGCLETLSSTTALINHAINVFVERMDLEKLISFAHDGDEKAIAIFQDAADYLGTAITFLVNTFNPSKIIIGKDFIRYAEFELDLIIKKVQESALKPNARDVKIKVSDFGKRSSVLGAAILPQSKIF